MLKGVGTTKVKAILAWTTLLVMTTGSALVADTSIVTVTWNKTNCTTSYNHFIMQAVEGHIHFTVELKLLNDQRCSAF